MKKAIDPDNQLDLSKRFICKNCGEYSPTQLKTCPKCSATDCFKDRYFQVAVSPEKRFKCKQCGAESSNRNEICPNCGSIEKQIERPTNSPIQDEKTIIADQSDNSDSIPNSRVNVLIPEIKEEQPKTEYKSLYQLDTKVLFCRECGTKLRPGAAFCTECGTKVITFDKPQEAPEAGTHTIPEPEKAESEAVAAAAAPDEISPAMTDPTAAPSVSMQISKLPPVLRRAFMLVEDGEWEKADTYFERVLDEEPENAYAYLGKLMIEKRAEELRDLAELTDLKDNRLFKRAARFADDDLKKTLLDLMGVSE